MNIKLDIEQLTQILTDFYTLSHVRTVIYDNSFSRVAAYPEHNSDFCTLMKQNPESKCLCRHSEKIACKICSEKNSLYIYKCHAGLIEAVAPIKMNDMILGYIMFGQILHNDTNGDAIISYASQFIKGEEILKKAFDKIKVRSDNQITAIASIMQACTSYLWISGLIKIDQKKHIYLLNDYIDQNISSNLSVDVLCSVLNVSRIKLYEIAHEYYGMSIGKYIRQKRISLAAKMLTENNSSVRVAAESVGFDDYNYFSKVFKRETGYMPTEYKKKYFDNKKASETI